MQHNFHATPPLFSLTHWISWRVQGRSRGCRVVAVLVPKGPTTRGFLLGEGELRAYSGRCDGGRHGLPSRARSLELGDRVGVAQGQGDVVQSLQQPPAGVVVD